MKKLLISLLLVPFLAAGNDFSLDFADTTHVQEDKLGTDRWKSCFNADACAKYHTDDRDKVLLIGKYANLTGYNAMQKKVLVYLLVKGANKQLGTFNSEMTALFLDLFLNYQETPEQYQDGVSNIVRGFILQQEKKNPEFLQTSGIIPSSHYYR